MKKVILIEILVLFFMGCAKNPFSSRVSESPNGSVGTWKTPQTPEVAVDNLLFAYNEHVISNYQWCFSDSFLFSAPEDSVNAPGLFDNWNRQTEIAAATNILRTFSNSDTMKLFLFLFPASNHSDFLVGDSLATLYRNYTIQIILTHAGIPDTTLARGLATFHLRQETLNWWTIYWWEDLLAPSAALDWGRLKALYK